MVYSEKFVAVVKNKGKILREKGDSVYLPFGSEYSILLKNLDTTRAVVNVDIDGSRVTDAGIVIGPNSSFELQGFLESDTIKNKFRFIEKTEQISDHRGDKIDDGLIRVEFSFELPQNEYHPLVIEKHIHHHDHQPYWYPYWYNNVIISSSGDTQKHTCGVTYSSSTVRNMDATFSSSVCDSNYLAQTQDCNDDGITVKGSEMHQSFSSTCVNNLSCAKTIIIKLKGYSDKGKVVEAVTTDKKIVCPSCGKKSPSGTSYCPNCGTHL